MKKILFIILTFILTIGLINANDIESISPQDSNSLLKNNEAVIVDVREIEETSQGAVKGAIYLPLSLLNHNKNEFDRLAMTLPKDKTIIVYCGSGRRAGIVGSELKKSGFKVLNMGAFDAWKNAKLETEIKTDPFWQEAKTLAGQLKSSLVKNLTDKIKSDGIEAAVPFCHANVKPIAKEAAKEAGKDYLTKYEFGRTSHKLRNEKNQALDWQESYLKEFVGTFYDDKKTQSYSKTGVLPDGKKFYIEPLFVQPVCLNCHGEHVAKGTEAKIKSLYPNDRATGFKLNEFRGLIWVKEK